MKTYLINTEAQSTGEHEVHVNSCTHLPDPKHRKTLGNHTNCKDAVKEAKKNFSNVDGCFYCCKECHTR